jgi:hypothetical protein
VEGKGGRDRRGSMTGCPRGPRNLPKWCGP